MQMQEMGTETNKTTPTPTDNTTINHHYHSDTELISSHSGPLSGPLNKRKSSKFLTHDSSSSSSSPHHHDKNNSFNNNSINSPSSYVEITLDVGDDSVAVHSVKAADGGDLHEDPELALLTRGLGKRSASFGSTVVRTASAKFRHVSQELKKLASFSKKPPARFDRTKSAATHALKGLKFISKTDGGAGWVAVEKRFDELSSNGLLHRACFGECIGMLYVNWSRIQSFEQVGDCCLILVRDEQGVKGVCSGVV